MSLASEGISRESYLEELLRADPNLAAALVLAAGFLVRVWAASGTFLNPDEALHLLIAHGNSLARAYQTSLTTAHPPLFILVLYLWRALGNSEFVLRLPSVIAGTVFGWMVFKWMSYTFGQTAGQKTGPTSRQLGILLLLPFVLTCGAAMMDKYPYGGTRHSAFLIPFVVAGVSFALAKLADPRIGIGLGAAILIVIVCHLFGAPHRPYMRRQDQSSIHMNRALDSVRRKVSTGDVAFLDFQSNFLFNYYFCPDVIIPASSSVSAFWVYPCAGYRVIFTGPETTIFTADTFLRRWDEMVRTFGLKRGDTVWVFQAGWDIGLARELQTRFPEFHELNPQTFGRNITLFKLTVGEPMPSGPP